MMWLRYIKYQFITFCGMVDTMGYNYQQIFVPTNLLQRNESF